MTLKEKGEYLLLAVLEIEELLQEEKLLLNKLKFHAELYKRGIDTGQIKQTGYDPSKDKEFTHPINPNKINFVILNNDERIELNPSLEY